MLGESMATLSTSDFIVTSSDPAKVLLLGFKSLIDIIIIEQTPSSDFVVGDIYMGFPHKGREILHSDVLYYYHRYL